MTIIVGQSLSIRIEDRVDGVWEKSVQELLFKEFSAIELMYLTHGLLEVELTGDLIVLVLIILTSLFSSHFR